MKKKLLSLVLLSAFAITLGACAKGSQKTDPVTPDPSDPGGGGGGGGTTDSITVKYYAHYTKMLQQEPEVFYQTTAKNGNKLTAPSETPTAPFTDFPIFKGWSNKEIIDNDEDLWDFSTDVVATQTKEFRLFAIWSTNEIPDPVPDEGAYIVGSFNNWKTEDKYFMDFNPDNDNEYYITNVSLTAGDKLKIYINTEDAWYGYEALKSGCAYKVNSDDEANIVIKTTGVYDFYFDYTAETEKLWINLQGEQPVASKYQVVVGGVYYDTVQNTSPQDPSYEEYYALNIPAKVGDEMQTYDTENSALWTIANLDSYSVGWQMSSGKIICTEAGNYDFYLKFKYGEDQVYIGKAS